MKRERKKSGGKKASKIRKREKRKLSLTSVLVREAEPGSHRHLRPDDPLPAVEVVLALVHVHPGLKICDFGKVFGILGLFFFFFFFFFFFSSLCRKKKTRKNVITFFFKNFYLRAPHPLGRPRDLPHQLRHHLVNRPAPAQVRAVVPVAGDDTVVERRRRFQSNDDRLLAVVEVAEAADLLRLVLHVGGDLEAPHAEHGLEELEQLGLGRGDGGGGRVDVVRLVGRDLGVLVRTRERREETRRPRPSERRRRREKIGRSKNNRKKMQSLCALLLSTSRSLFPPSVSSEGTGAS